MASDRFIIVGAGYAGLTAAIELTRKGFRVEVFESAKRFTAQGDTIITNPSITRIFSKWGDVLPDLIKVSEPVYRQVYQDSQGKKIYEVQEDHSRDGYPALVAPRGLLHLSMYQHALQLGVKIHFATPITKVFEEDDCAGVYVNGERVEAIAVIAADGVNSKVRQQAVAEEYRSGASGYAIFRAFFDTDVLREDPKTRYWAECEGGMYFWVGEGVHSIVIPHKSLGKISCFITHKDDTTIGETWTSAGNLSSVLKTLNGWDENLRALFSKIPPGNLSDFKLLWCDPLKEWVSPKGKILLIGDCAHAHLPTSAAGAMQAVEDGATIAALLDALRKEEVPTVFRVFQKLRFDRVDLTQRLGWENRSRFHNTNWEAVKEDPEWIKVKQDDWLLTHDAEKYAYDNAAAALENVKIGTPFKSTNVPEGYVHKEWSYRALR